MEDKLLHTIVGIAIMFIGLKMVDVKWTLIALTSAAIGKELFDRFIQNERFDIYDALVTIIAGVLFLKIRTKCHIYHNK